MWLQVHQRMVRYMISKPEEHSDEQSEQSDEEEVKYTSLSSVVSVPATALVQLVSPIPSLRYRYTKMIQTGP